MNAKTDPAGGYKIVALEAENIKRLQAVEIRPDGNLVEITGENGQGKTSVLDAIWWALTGGRNIQTTPIRKGQEAAIIKLDLGDLRVVRTFKAKEGGEYTTTLRVEDAQGARYDGPQDVLNALIGDLSFDPLAFQRMKPREQYDILRAFVPDVDFEQLDRLNKRDFELRTDVNRKAKNARAQAEGIKVPEVVPEEEVDVSKVSEQLREAQRFNTEIEQRKSSRAAAQAKVDDLDAQILKLTAERDELKDRLAAAEPLPEPKDTEALTRQIEEAGATNEVFHRAKRKADLVAEAEAAEKESEELTAAMEKRNEEKSAAIERAELPVEGLSFGDGIVLLNGVPFEQASDAEQLRASIAIAEAKSEGLRVIRVRDGSLFDANAMEFLRNYAKERDIQIWIERVGHSGTTGFILEDGLARPIEAPEAF